MFKVFIQGEEFHEVEFSRHSTLEDAIALALYLHRSSNVKHFITVYNVDDNKVSIEFNRGENV